jgi:hypothetical protein
VRRLRLALLAAPLLLALAVAACRSHEQAAADERGPRGEVLAPVASAEAGDRIVLVSGALEGSVEPCRCSEGMLGGLPRRASLVARFALPDAPLVDLGDLGRPADTSDTIMELREKAALEALASMAPAKLHLIALGETDVRLGMDRLARLTPDSLTWLAANVTASDPKKAFLKASVVSGDLAFVAVIDPEIVGTIEGYTVSPAREAVLKELPGLKGKQVIVLFHGEPAAAKKALGDVPGLALIVGAHSEVALRTKTLATGAAFVTLEIKGQRLHAFALRPGKGLVAEAHHDLDNLLPDAQVARDVLDRFYEAATKLVPGMPTDKLPGEGGRFAGSASCNRECHSTQFTAWTESKHSRALENLEAKDPKRAGLAECIRCHTVGFGFEGGYSPGGAPEVLGAVGCESCHGPASNHLEVTAVNGDGTGFGRLPGKWPERWRDRCIRCHDPANSPGFVLETYLEKIRHWGPR